MLKIIKRLRLVVFNKSNKTNIRSVRANLKANYGRNVSVGFNSFVDENVQIGDYSYINSNSYIENCSIGKFCSISSGVYISPFEHDYSLKSTHPLLYNSYYKFVQNDAPPRREKVIIGNDVLISLNAIILQGVVIGDGAVIGAGAIVTKDVRPYEIVGGVPARHIKFRFDEETIEQMKCLKWWDWDTNKIRNNISFLRNQSVDIKE